MAEYPVEYRESPLKARARALLNILAGNTSINSRGLRDVTGKQPGDLSGSRGRITQPSPVTAKTVAAPYDVPLAPPKSESRYERAAEPSPAKPASTRAASAQSVLDAINKAGPGPEYNKLFDREHDRVARLGNNFRNAPLGDNARNALNALTQGWRGAAEIHDIPLMTPEQRRAAVMQINTPGLPADVRLNDARIAAMRAETNDLARRGNLENFATNAAYPVVSDLAKMKLGLKGAPVQYGFPDRDVVTPGMMRVADADALLKRIDAGGSAAGPANVNPVSALRGAPGSMTNAMRAMQALGGASAPATQGRQLNPEPNPGMDYQKWRDLKSASLADTGKRAEFDNRTISPARPKARFGGAFKEDPKKQEQYLESRKEIAAERRGKVQDQRERAAAQREFEGGNPELMLDRLGGGANGGMPDPGRLMNQARLYAATGQNEMADLLNRQAAALMQGEGERAKNVREDRRLALGEASMLEDARKSVQAEHPDYDENQIEREARRRLGVKGAAGLLPNANAPLPANAEDAAAKEAMPLAQAQAVLDRLHQHRTLMGLGITPETTADEIASLTKGRLAGQSALDEPTLALIGKYLEARRRVDPEFSPKMKGDQKLFDTLVSQDPRAALQAYMKERREANSGTAPPVDVPLAF